MRFPAILEGELPEGFARRVMARQRKPWALRPPQKSSSLGRTESLPQAIAAVVSCRLRLGAAIGGVRGETSVPCERGFKARASLPCAVREQARHLTSNTARVAGPGRNYFGDEESGTDPTRRNRRKQLEFALCSPILRSATMQPRKTAFDLRFPNKLPAIHNHIGSSIVFAFLTDPFQPINNLGNH